MDFLETSSLPNNNYKKLFDKFSNINTIQVEEWKKPELLGYFCKKYFDTYQTKYSFKFNSPTPSKCFEIFQIGSLCLKLSSDPKILKNYIDWMFENYVPKAKRKLTSISFLTKDENLTHYKLNVLSNQTNQALNRSTNLPLDIKEILLSYGISIQNYAELAFLYNISPEPDNVSKAKSKLELNGFDPKVLERIK